MDKVNKNMNNLEFVLDLIERFEKDEICIMYEFSSSFENDMKEIKEETKRLKEEAIKRFS